MKKFIFGVLIFSAGFSYAQTILNAKSPEEFRQLREENQVRKGDSIVSMENIPLPYGYINEEDVLKSIVTWEIIDLNDKINQPIYHNSNSLEQPSKSLFQVIIDGIRSGKITEVYDDDSFTAKLTPEQVEERMSNIVLSDDLLNKISSGEEVTEQDRLEGTDVYEAKSENIRLLKIKGMWYIDKREGQMKYRLLGIAAMGQDPQTMGVFGPDGQPINQGNQLVDLFWIFYPDIRPLTANTVVFNPRNQASGITFDDILNARRFSSIIYKSSVGLGNGVISDYIPRDAEAQMEESDRIKNQILEMENSMWNY